MKKKKIQLILRNAPIARYSQTEVSLYIINRGSPRLESYFKGSSVIKRLRKVALMSAGSVTRTPLRALRFLFLIFQTNPYLFRGDYTSTRSRNVAKASVLSLSSHFLSGLLQVKNRLSGSKRRKKKSLGV